jgi:hypothetical protein
MGSYALLLAISAWVNRRDGKMLAMTIAVGTGILLPIPDNGFYLVCIAVEIMVAMVADMIDNAASRIIIWLSTTLMILHGMGAWLDGYPSESPYSILVQFCEHAEIIACIVLSK